MQNQGEQPRWSNLQAAQALALPARAKTDKLSRSTSINMDLHFEIPGKACKRMKQPTTLSPQRAVKHFKKVKDRGEAGSRRFSPTSGVGLGFAGAQSLQMAPHGKGGQLAAFMATTSSIYSQNQGMRSTFAATMKNAQLNYAMGKTTTNNLLSPVISESDAHDQRKFIGTTEYFA